jgi:site-specific recombinase XerD
MLEHYFVRPRTADRIRSLWLGPAIEQYVEWMTQRQAAEQTVKGAVHRLVRFNTFALSHGATTWEELPALAEAFIAHWIQEHSGYCRTAQDRAAVNSQARVPVEGLLRLLLPGFEGTQRTGPLPFASSAPGFFTHLYEERGLRPMTVHRYRHHLRSFEVYLDQVDSPNLSELTPALINTFIIERAKVLSPGSVGGCGSVLRMFFRYLYREGLIATDLSRAVPRGRTYRQSAIPRSISQDDVQRVIDSVDRRDALGKRDYAMMLLLINYGLRAREIAAMQLEDIDWPNAQLHVTARKGGHATIYPLSTSAGEAIIEYLRCSRPDVEHRALFITTKAPYDPISHWCVSQRAGQYIRAAGIKVHRPGSHTFRHSCVQRMVDADIPFKIIGDYVGHRCPASTQIYGKVALHKLRALALGDAEEML